MAKTRFRDDSGLTRRMGFVVFLLGALYVAFGAVLITRTGFALGLVIVVGMAVGQWYFSDKLALASMKAREVSPQQAPELHGMIDRLVALADMPKPKVYIADTDLPNAFATGRSPQHSAVCVTTGIMRRIDADELEGVLAHELSHIAHRDVAVMTVASSLGLLAGFITRWGLYFGGGNNRNSNSGPALIVVWAVSLVVYAISFLLTRALSRYRELSADRAGAYLTGKPSSLASALVKISGEIGRIPTKDLRDKESMNAFFFAPAFSKDSLSSLIATHPSTDKRVEQLSSIAADLGRPF
ncbi:zinc metalloprotease HtpX [Solicola sp. PLA-1-18]|uniref:zinc metalloprotease HtpX n=1 Tax=Solicola sp. PLA-1-18 TaxID=3380532 RepID=UPI003B7EB551